MAVGRAGANFWVFALCRLMSQYERLRCYSLAAELSDELWRAVNQWPTGERQSFGLQLVRAVDSVGANIAEATGRWYAGDKRRLLYIARGSLYETEHWIGRAKARGLLDDRHGTTIIEIGKTLNGLIKRPKP
jgi:four helix bundle protein